MRGSDRNSAADESDPDLLRWFMDRWPFIKSHFRPEDIWFDFVQKEGETVYIPRGWFHAVINLETSLALTHNFCSVADTRAVWGEMETEAPDIASLWLQCLGSSPSIPKHSRKFLGIR